MEPQEGGVYLVCVSVYCDEVVQGALNSFTSVKVVLPVSGVTPGVTRDFADSFPDSCLV